MRVKTLRCAKKEDFDYTVNDFIRLSTTQGCVIQFLQITHMADEFVASVVYEEHINTGEERAPEFIVADAPDVIHPEEPIVHQDEPVLEVEGKAYANIDAYEKY